MNGWSSYFIGPFKSSTDVQLLVVLCQGRDSEAVLIKSRARMYINARVARKVFESVR